MNLPIGSVIDVGVQYETVELRLLFKDIKQLLVEPIVEYNEIMAKNYHRAGVDFEIVNVAASNQNGEFYLETSSIVGSGKITHARSTNKTEGPNVRAIPARTLDSLIAERNLPKPYLLKIDVDGAELSILQGAGLALQDCSVVIVEVQMRNLLERTAELTKAGFQIFDVCDLCYYDAQLSQMDLVFINVRKFPEYSKGPILGRFDPSKWQKLI